MNSNITEMAIKQHNEDKQAKVLDLAQSKITYILKEKAQIASFRDQIKVHQEANAKLADDLLTVLDVLGRQPSASPSQNEATILNAIKARNDDKQKSIESNSKAHIKEIDSYLLSIKGCEDRIAGLVKELNELSHEEVTAAQILG